MREHASGSAPSAGLQHARDAHRALEKVRRRLLQPSVQALDASTADLNDVVQCLERLQISLSQDRRPAPLVALVAPEIQRLRTELRAVATLVGAAGRFYAGWSRLINAVDQESPNYSSGGQSPAPIPIDTARVVMHG